MTGSAEDNASERWARLPADQRALIEARLQHMTAGEDTEKIEPRPERAWAPLSFAQAGLWFLDRLGAGSANYNRSWGLRLSGELDRNALERAVNQVIQRHEILRTTIAEVDGVPRQLIRDSWPLSLGMADLSTLPVGERISQATRSAAQDARLPFDLAAERVMRVQLYRLKSADYLLAVTAHRSAFDAWSARLLARELSAFYEADVGGRAAALSPLPVQYGDVAAWQRRRLQGAELERLLAFWEAQLAGEVPALRLPSLRPRPAAPTHRAACRRMLMPAPLRDRLRLLGQQSDATLYMVLLAVFCLLLGRYTGEEDFLVGTPVAGRTRIETEGLIGLFLNTLVLRADLSGSPSFLEFLRRMRQTTLAALAHQDLPFERLVEALRPERRPDRQPIFQVLFNLENIPELPQETGALQTAELEFETGVSQHDLSLEVLERAGGLACALRYRTDLFEEEAMDRLLGHYRTLLEAVVADPGVPITHLPMLTPAERRQALVEWNDTRADFPREACIHQLFEAQVERTPQAVAAVDPREQATYAEMNARANRIARSLRRRGVGPGSLVGVVADRSLEMVIGMLGALKAGGAYMALDPRLPPARLVYMLQDSGVTLVLAPSGIHADLPGYTGDVLGLDSEAGSFAAEESADLEASAKPSDLAYVIYTSGSTGTPKGVPIPHRGVVNYLTFLARTYALTGSDVILQLASPSFDMSVREIFGPLIVGARLVLLGSRDVRDPEHVLSQIHAQQVTCLLGVVPTLLNALSGAAARPDRPATSLRVIMTAGEALRQVDLERAQAAFPEVAVFVNQYGPTEITMIATQHPARGPQAATPSGTVLIGRPISNVQVYVLDKHLQPAPVGVPGELFIGGVGVAPGYLNRPELTAERFLPHPTADRPGERLYRSGDRACFHADGNLEFLGRLDNQVKVRGYRVELGEIEVVLARHPAVRQAAVLAAQDPGQDTRLIAYCVPVPGETVRPGLLRGFLEQTLPDFMIPAAFVTLTAMPLTPSGKIDRQALPVPGQAQRDLEAPFVAPRTTAEVAMARIWCELLDLNQVGIHDNFFDLGGHSLLAARVIARMREVFHVEVGLRQFFDADPTVARMAEQVVRLQELGLAGSVPPASTESGCLVPIQPGGSRPPLFCIHWATGHVAIYRDLARHLDPDQPVFGLQALGLDGVQRPHTRIEAMAAHYIGEIRRVQPSGPYYLAGASMGGKIAFEMAQQLQAQGDEIALLALIDSAGHVDREPLPVDARLQLHSNNLRRLGWSGGARYILRRLKLRLRRAVYVPLVRSGRPLPRFLRSLPAIAYATSRDYHPRLYRGRVTLFKASRRPVGGTTDPFLGWDRVAEGGMEVHVIPGDHVTLMKEPGVRLLAEELERCLTRASS